MRPVTITAAILTVAGLKLAAPLLAPIAFGVMIAAVSSPLVSWLGKHKLPGLAAAMVVLVMDLLMVAALGALAVSASSDLQTELPALLGGVDREFQELARKVSPNHPVKSLFSAERIELAISGLAASFAGVASFTTVAFLVTFFALCEMDGSRSVGARLRAAAPKAARHFDLVERITKDVRSYLWVKALTSLILAIATWAVLEAFGLPLATLLGLAMFVFHFIPNVGGAVVVSVAVLVGVGSKGMPVAAAVGASLLVLTGLVGQLLEPLLLSRTVSLSPLVVLLGLLVWGWMWGPMGALLSLPLMIILKVALEQTSLSWVAELLGPEPVQKIRRRAALVNIPPPRPSAPPQVQHT